MSEAAKGIALLASLAPSMVRVLTGAVAMSHAERPSIETDGTELVQVRPQKPSTQGRASWMLPMSAATRSAPSSTPLTAPDARSSCSPMLASKTAKPMVKT